MSKKKEVIQTTGKRKKAIARAVAMPGKGMITINDKSLEVYQPEMLKMMIKEPLMLAENSSLDISVKASGGGIFGQATAIREAIAKALVEHDETLKERFLEYDRTMLVSDSRRTEPHHPSASKRGSRRHKQRSKR
ncbi:MAG: 30S ribosomal protein S9 [Candidatus Aenigmatarchaeota archaeon]